MLNWYKEPESVPKNIHYTTTSLNRWHNAGWTQAFMFFTSKSDPSSKCCSRNGDSAGQGIFAQFWWPCANFSLFSVLSKQVWDPLWPSATVTMLFCIIWLCYQHYYWHSRLTGLSWCLLFSHRKHLGRKTTGVAFKYDCTHVCRPISTNFTWLWYTIQCSSAMKNGSS